MSQAAEVHRRRLRHARVPLLVWGDPRSTTTHKVDAVLKHIPTLMATDNLTELKTIFIVGENWKKVLGACAATAKALVTLSHPEHKVKFVQMREIVEAMTLYYSYSHRDPDSEYYGIYRTNGGDSSLVIPDLGFAPEMPQPEEGIRQDFNMRLRSHLLYGGNLVVGVRGKLDSTAFKNLEPTTYDMLVGSMLQTIRV